MARQIIKKIRKIDPNSLYVLNAEWKVRKLIIALVQHKVFEFIMMMAILGNSICLAIYDYSDPDDKGSKNQILGVFDTVFTGIYTFEAVMKILAYGFVVHRKSYLRDAWNVLDFVSLAVSYISLLPGVPNFKPMRILRVMKPLRSVNSMPAMKKLFNTLIMSLPQIGQVVLFMLFVFGIFAILGNQLFKEDLYQRCRLTPKPIVETSSNQSYWPIDQSQKRLCGGLYECQTGTYCGAPHEYGLLLESENLTSDSTIKFGFLHFDDIGIGILSIFRVVTLEGWSQVMYNYMDSTGLFSSLYFPLVVLLGSFFLLNLFLAVIMETFSEMSEIQKLLEKAKSEAKDRKMRKMLAERANQEELDGSGLQRQGTSKNKMIQRMISVNERKNEMAGKKIMSFADIAILMLAHKNQLKKRKEAQEAVNGPEPLINIDNISEDSQYMDEEPIEFDEKGARTIPGIDSNSNDASADAQRSADLIQQNDSYQQSNNPLFEDTWWDKTRQIMYLFCMTGLFQWVITLSIVINTVCLSLDKYPPDDDLIAKLDSANIFFFTIFLLEMIIKFLGMGPRIYAKDQFNLFDAFVVLISIVDLILNYSVDSSAGGASAISALRAFRLVRIFKLAKSWTQLQHLLRTIAQSLKDISSFSVLILLLIFIYTLIGLELFGHQVKFTYDESQVVTEAGKGFSPRNNFDDFYHAFLVVFQVLLSDNWDEIMFTFARVKGSTAILFFVSLIVIGVMFFLNIFLAILLENFGVDSDLVNQDNRSTLAQGHQADTENQSQLSQPGKQGIFSRLAQNLKNLVKPQLPTPTASRVKRLAPSTASKDPLMLLDSQVFNDPSKGIEIMTPRKDLASPLAIIVKDQKDIPKTSRNDMNRSMIAFEGDLMLPGGASSSRVADTPKIMGDLSFLESSPEIIVATPRFKNKSLALILKEKKNEQRILDQHLNTQAQTFQDPEGRSLGVLGPDNKFRVFLVKLTSNSTFDGMIIAFIAISSIMLALDNPLNDPDGGLSKFLEYTDMVFTSIFALESIMKILAFGLYFNGENSYLKNTWNLMDFSIVCLSILSLSLSSVQGLQIIKVFRLLRVLRPLRLIRRVKLLKIAIQALFKAIPSIFNVVVVSLLFLVIFGIIGINYFKGSFTSCRFPKSLRYPNNFSIDNISSKFDCLTVGGDWVNADANFDHMAIAVNTLFQISSTEGWGEIMQNGMDSVGIDMQPKREYSLYWSLFFIVFVVFGDFFIMNLFAGVVVMTFNKEKEVLGKSHLLNDKQKKWIEQKRSCIAIQPLTMHLAHESRLREVCRNIILSHWFNYLIFGMITGNAISLGITWYNEPKAVTNTTSALNYVFSSFFILEMILKLVGLGIGPYFNDSWNQFDFVVVVVSIVSEIISQAGGSQIGAAVNFVRAIRVQRMLRYIKRAKRIRVIFQTFIVTLPSLGSVGGLLMLCLYMYAVLGVFLFANIKLQESLSTYANFQSFGLALLTLWRCSTGESWNSIMMDVMRQRSITFQCDDSGTFNYGDYIKSGMQTQGCGIQLAGVTFFISFYLVVVLIFLNLFIAIILEGFTTTNNAMSSLLQEDDLEHFVDCFARFDPSGSGYLKVKDFPAFLFLLKSPLGWDAKRFEGNQKAQDDFLEELHIPTYNGFQDFLFWDIIQALAKLYMVKVEMRKVIKQEIDDLHDSGKLDFQLNGDEDDQLIIQMIEDRIAASNQEHKVMKMQLRLELEFEVLDLQMRDCLDVQLVRMTEDAKMRQYNPARDIEYTSAHIKAGRVIMQALKKLVSVERERKKGGGDELERKQSEEKVKGVIQAKKVMQKSNFKQVSPYQQVRSRQGLTIDILSSIGQNSQQLKDTWSPKDQNRDVDTGILNLSEIVKDEEKRLAEEIIMTFDKRQHW